jgi:hypothetical protein
MVGEVDDNVSGNRAGVGDGKAALTIHDGNTRRSGVAQRVGLVGGVGHYLAAASYPVDSPI